MNFLAQNNVILQQQQQQQYTHEHPHTHTQTHTHTHTHTHTLNGGTTGSLPLAAVQGIRAVQSIKLRSLHCEAFAYPVV